MTTLITYGDTTIEPTVVDGYESAREAQTIIHPILGRAVPDVTLRPASTRTGTLTLVFGGASAEADSQLAESTHALGGVLSLVSDDVGSVDMSYVASGEIKRQLEDETRAVWVVTVDFTEVSA